MSGFRRSCVATDSLLVSPADKEQICRPRDQHDNMTLNMRQPYLLHGGGNIDCSVPKFWCSRAHGK